MTASDDAIRKHQQRVFREYAASLGLPDPYTYPDGNPIRPLPPVQTRCGGLMIVGAYPSARFESRPSTENPGRRRLVPVADNLRPFADEQYFDGTQVRTLVSTEGLRSYLLEPLGLMPDECWITDLVKVFLYKPDHESSCNDAVPGFNVPVTRGRFMEFGRKSLPWLVEETNLCKPSVIVTLGEEVARVVLDDTKTPARQLLIQSPIEFEDASVVAMPHPDACRRSEYWRGSAVDQVQVIANLLRRVAV